MKINVAIFSFTIFILSVIGLKAQKSVTEPWNYILNIELNDSSLWVILNVKITNVKTGEKGFFLFNRYIQIEEALLDGKPLIFKRSNDTLCFETFQKKEMTLFMKYRIPCSLTESSKVIASYSDNIFAYPVLLDTSQIFCERFNKWYPVLYDHFANYKVTIIVPKTHYELSHIWLGIHTEYLAKGKFFIGESIPEYINLMFYESWAGNGAFEKAIQEKIKLTLFDVPFYTVTFEQVLNQRKGDSHADEIIYHKGVAFIHEFQKMIGREKLLKIIRETYSSPNHLVTLIDFENGVKANDCWKEYLKLYKIEL